MPQPDLKDIHVDALLTMLSVGYRNPELIATQIFPIVVVEKESDIVPKYVQDFWFRDVARALAPGDKAPRSGWTVDNTQKYSVTEFGIAKEIPDRIRNNTDQPFDMDRDSTNWVTDMILLRYEVDWASSFFTTSQWTGGVGGGDVTPTNLWDDYALSDPIVDIRDNERSVRQLIGRRANTLVIGELVKDKLIDHPLFVERVKYTGKQVTMDGIASLLGIEKVLVGSSMQATNAEGATLSLSDLFGNAALLLYSPPSAGMFQPAAGYTFVQRAYSGGEHILIRRIRDEERMVDIIEGRTAYDQLIIDARAGAFFSNVVA